ncbi:MAG TPA: hypothetical protein VGR28_08995 [Candidatus Thermoplasmatota archaeon]|jgi:hypothetical protein|nr:hypothetical protein [Candidatus Thermoplasmatota archaeon]
MRLAPLVVATLLALPAAALALGPLDAAPAPALADGDLVARAQAMLLEPVRLGRSPQGWIDWAEAQLRAPAVAADATDLAGAIAALYASAGLVADDATLADLDARVAALDPAAAASLAPLVATMAQVYAQQRAVAAQVDLAPALRDGLFVPSGAWASEQLHALDGHFDPALADATRVVLPPAAAQASVANAEQLVAAAMAFRAAADGGAFELAGPFTDPLGLVVLGSPGSDVFVPGGALGQPILVADPGGDDLDLTSAGGACPVPLDAEAELGQFDCNGLVASLRVDAGGDDTYTASATYAVAQGAGALGGLGVLVDAAGDDLYQASQVSTQREFMYYIAAGVQGSGEGGAGLLLDLQGNDRYVLSYTSGGRNVFMQSQGFAGLGGFGALVDGTGADTYNADLVCQTANRVFCGVYILGTALYPGVAIALDGEGDDFYRGYVRAPQEDYYSQSFAAFGGVGIEVDLLGDDVYIDSATSYNPQYSPSLNCAYASGMYGGAHSLFLDAAGNDDYLSETYDLVNDAKITSESYSLAGTSLFWDVSGDDHHTMRALGSDESIVLGRGALGTVLDRHALYLDTGGLDVYADEPADQTVGADMDAWLTGADLNVVPTV